MMSVLYRLLMFGMVVALVVVDDDRVRIPLATRFLAFPAFMIAMGLYDVADAINALAKKRKEGIHVQR